MKPERFYGPISSNRARANTIVVELRKTLPQTVIQQMKDAIGII